MQNRRALLQGSLTAAAVLGAPSHAGAVAPMTQARTRNVRDFGAKGDGITDDTEAFNRATRADAEWSWEMLSSILVPAGRYRVDGTVFLRKGQSLIGEGLSTYIDAAKAKGSTFVMGRKRGGRRGVEDPGGLPVRIEKLIGLGGVDDQGFIFAAIPGFQISALFLTAVGIGIEIEAADGIVSDVEVDQCLSGIQIRKSQNIVLTNLNFYVANYGVSFLGECRDIAISNSTFCYTKYATILFGDGCRQINSVTINGCIFTNNIPYKTFSGYIYSRASDSDLLVAGCIFRNAPGYAVIQDAGVGLQVVMRGCIFDGARSRPDYNQSLAPKGVRTGHGKFAIADCLFQNLQEGIRVSPYLDSLDLDGGSFSAIERLPIVVEDATAGPISVRGVRGLAPVRNSGSVHDVTLPYLGVHTRLSVTVSGRTVNAPILAAQYAVASSRDGVIVDEVWRSGSAPRQAMSAPASVGARLRDGAIQLSLEARQFGSASPSIDVTACS